MATPMRVPRQYEGGFAKIRDLSDESFQELLAALQQVPNTYNQDSLLSAAAEKVDTIAASDVEDIVSALLSLYIHRDHSQMTISDIVDGVTQTMEESKSEQLKLSSEDRPHIEERLAELLSIEALTVVVRAGRLSIESEHSLQEVRIVTDTRLVFEPEDPEVEPRGAIILHTLKISYWGDNRSKNFFVTLDSNGLRELRQQLDRANAKADTLTSTLKAAQVPYIDAE
jgi:hypothetical protein